VKAYLEIIRPSVLFLSVFAVIVGALVVGYFDVFHIAIASIVALLIAGAGNTVNDYYDHKIDRMNKPKRPIPSGRLKRKNALIFAAILYTVANILAMLDG
jgi:geranylgeranylglycerol-phosphate geranylgeranyltransferase